MEKTRNVRLDALKGFAIVLVMTGHCLVLNKQEDGILYDAIKAVQMPLFMAVSGFLAAGRLHFIDTHEYKCKIVKRMQNYLIPFTVWIGITNFKHFFTTLLAVLFELDRGLWFLMILFLCTMLLYTGVWLKDVKKWGWIGFFIPYCMAGAVLFIQIMTGNTFLSPHLMINYLPFHLGAYLCGLALKKRQIKAGTVLRGTCCLVFFLLFIWLVCRFDMVTALSRAEWLIQVFASLTGVIFCFILFDSLPSGRGMQVFSFLGGFTLEIYVLHFRFARITGFSEIDSALYSPQWFLGLIYAFVVMGLCTFLCIIVLRRFKISRFLLFGKS